VNLSQLAFSDVGRQPGLGSPVQLGYRDAATVRAVQTKLTELARADMEVNPGPSQLAPGTIDGKYGPNTARAVKALQFYYGREQTGLIDDWVLQALGLTAPAGGGAATPSTTGGGGGGAQKTPIAAAPPTVKKPSSALWWAGAAVAAVIVGRRVARRRSTPG